MIVSRACRRDVAIQEASTRFAEHKASLRKSAAAVEEQERALQAAGRQSKQVGRIKEQVCCRRPA